MCIVFYFDVVVYGIDIGKKVFYVVGMIVDGQVVQWVKFSCDMILVFFMVVCVVWIGMEVCLGL